MAKGAPENHVNRLSFLPQAYRTWSAVSTCCVYFITNETDPYLHVSPV